MCSSLAHGPLVKRLRRHPLTVESGVRFPWGSYLREVEEKLC